MRVRRVPRWPRRICTNSSIPCSTPPRPITRDGIGPRPRSRTRSRRSAASCSQRGYQRSYVAVTPTIMTYHLSRTLSYLPSLLVLVLIPIAPIPLLGSLHLRNDTLAEGGSGRSTAPPTEGMEAHAQNRELARGRLPPMGRDGSQRSQHEEYVLGSWCRGPGSYLRSSRGED